MSIAPSSLSLPSPRASPAPSSDISVQTPVPTSSRKRPRNDISPEDRKEARAHRNRIAAQHSRDRRKAQFSLLERRVAELEEENRQLRANLVSVTAATVPPTPADNASARDKENEELRERIRTLEKGWDAVVKALAAQGLPTGLPTPQTTSLPASPSSDSSSSSSPSATAFPVLSEHLGRIRVRVHSPPSTGGDHRDTLGVPAAGGLATTSHTSLGTSSPESELQYTPSSPVIDDVAMEALFHEILAPTPPMSSTSLPPDSSSVSIPEPAAALASSTSSVMNPPDMDWMYAEEMQRMLDMLPSVQTNAHQADADEPFDLLSALDLDLGGSGWELENWASSSTGIGVF